MKLIILPSEIAGCHHHVFIAWEVVYEFEPMLQVICNGTKDCLGAAVCHNHIGILGSRS